MDHEESIRRFRQRVLQDFIVSFCNARAEDYQPEGFDLKTLDRISGLDAHWFLVAVDEGLVAQSGGFFTFPQSKAKEQVFWSGLKGVVPRRTSLWVEPVVTIGACARLIREFNWPIALVGAQSERPWPFDMVCKHPDDGRTIVAGEVKGSRVQLDKMLVLMKEFAAIGPVDEAALSGDRKNAYRKVKGLRKERPAYFWALGPEGYDAVFDVGFGSDKGAVYLKPIHRDALRFSSKTL